MTRSIFAERMFLGADNHGGRPVSLPQPHAGYGMAKRLIDIVGALGGLIVTGPLLLLAGILIKVDSPGPIIHRRSVLGRGGRIFSAYKLRTMISDADRYLEKHPVLMTAYREDFKLTADPRITRVGKWLRKVSIDELPQLANVLRGEMSLVGPRMISPSEVGKYGKQREQLLAVKPGITGLWQVSGRQEINYDERVRIDLRYIDRRSLWLDLEIILMTIPALVRGRGAY